MQIGSLKCVRRVGGSWREFVVCAGVLGGSLWFAREFLAGVCARNRGEVGAWGWRCFRRVAIAHQQYLRPTIIMLSEYQKGVDYLFIIGK